MGPTAYQPSCLVVEMRKFHLQTSLGRSSTLAENFEDQTRTINCLETRFFFEVSLLNGGQCRIHYKQIDFERLPGRRYVLYLSTTQERGCTRIAHAVVGFLHNIQTDSQSKAFSFCKPRSRANRCLTRKFGINDESAVATGELVGVAPVKNAQTSPSSKP